MAQLLHFAGCTLASVHPEPLATFTDKTVDFSDGDASTAAPGDKESEFANYAEAYYTTLNVRRCSDCAPPPADPLLDSQDIQLSLRTSIRHLRLARASPAPLIDPHFSALSNPGGGSVGVGGLAMGADLTSVEPAPGEGEEGAGVRLSVRAREIEREAWVELESALKDDAGRMDKDGDTAGSVEADTGP